MRRMAESGTPSEAVADEVVVLEVAMAVAMVAFSRCSTEQSQQNPQACSHDADRCCNLSQVLPYRLAYSGFLQRDDV